MTKHDKSLKLLQRFTKPAPVRIIADGRGRELSTTAAPAQYSWKVA